MSKHAVRDTGLSVVYEPEAGIAVTVDIVIVHGLQGHPYKTWACTNSRSPRVSPEPPASPTSGPDSGVTERKSSFRKVLSLSLRRQTSKASAKSPKSPKSAAHVKEHASSSRNSFRVAGLGVDSLGDGDNVVTYAGFWPRDLLPSECPKARVLVYGYDSKVTKYMASATNENTVFSHGKDLLFELARERIVDRPLVFVAHSLGGIVVKEMLARSSASAEKALTNVVESTAGVIFLGTPHRGSRELAALGEWARSFISKFRLRTNASILDALGLKTTDLERAQEAFSALWQKHGFRVKTFQEGLGLTGFDLGVLGNKVVPDYSSLLGDARERAETIQANHMEMCRFSGPDDPNYRKVSGEIASIYASLLPPQKHAQEVHRRDAPSRRNSSLSHAEPARGPQQRRKTTVDPDSLASLTTFQRRCLDLLWYPALLKRLHSLEKPTAGTCDWLFLHQSYRQWLSRQDEDSCGLLWIKGKPGAGKSTVMKEAFLRASSRQHESGFVTASFFFNAKGDDLEHSPVGLFRSLLFQLLPWFPDKLAQFIATQPDSRQDSSPTPAFDELDLKTLFQSIFTGTGSGGAHLPGRVIIFIDALDECEEKAVRTQAYFWREITRTAWASDIGLSVCLSSRHFPSISVPNCQEIVAENHNGGDIAIYVDHRLNLGIPSDSPERQAIKDVILDNSSGVFLWVVLVVDAVLQQRDEGKSLQFLLKELDTIPDELEALFLQTLRNLAPASRGMAARLFQWAILATEPLRVQHWHHILAFIRQPPPASIRQWRRSEHVTESDDQLEKQIRTLSGGLIEIAGSALEPHRDFAGTVASVAASVAASETGSSFYARAGSLDLEYGETRLVQVVHESVREFFLRGNGFGVLSALSAGGGDAADAADAIAAGHLSIMATLLDYLEIKELDALVEARKTTRKPQRARNARLKRTASFVSFDSVASFESAGSRSSHMSRETASESNESDGPGGPGGLDGPVIHPPLAPALPYGDNRHQGRAALSGLRKAASVEESVLRWKAKLASQFSRPEGGHPQDPSRRRSYSPNPSRPTMVSLNTISPAVSPQSSSSSSLPSPVEVTLLPRPQALATDASPPDVPPALPPVEHSVPGHPTTSGRPPSPSVVSSRQSMRSRATRASVKSRLMEAHPALLSYATTNFFRHARLAEEAGAAPVPVIDRFGPQTWTRFLLLCEEPDHDTTSLLYHAASQKLSSWVDYICQQGADADHPSPHVAPAVREAVRKSNSAALRLILRGRRHPDLFVDGDGSPLLFSAIDRHDVATAAELIWCGADVNALDNGDKKNTPLHAACSSQYINGDRRKPDYEMVKLLLDTGADVNAARSDGDRPLHRLCRPGYKIGINFEVLALLIDWGADVINAADVESTALNLVCAAGEDGRDDRDDLAAVIMLLDAGADPKQKSSGETALHKAAKKCKRGVVAELIRRGADVAARDGEGKTPLHLAVVQSSVAELDSFAVVEELVANMRPDEVDIRTSWGLFTALHFACSRLNTGPIVEALLRKGAKAYTIKDTFGRNAYEIAKRHSRELLPIIRELSCDAPQHQQREPSPSRRAQLNLVAFDRIADQNPARRTIFALGDEDGAVSDEDDSSEEEDGSRPADSEEEKSGKRGDGEQAPKLK